MPATDTDHSPPPQTAEPAVGSRGDLPLGTEVGRYRVVRQLGQGGMGSIYVAEHMDIGQRAAIKVLRAELSQEQKYVQRFFQEARAASAVAHPGLVKIFDFNQLADGTLFLVMELLAGSSLWNRYEELAREGRWLSLQEAVRITRRMASALTAVHQKGIIHRDLKPENVILVPDPDMEGGERPKLLDFGIAKMDNVGRKTTTGVVLGTPLYMSPEQCSGSEQLTDKVDVYALGAMLYEMLTSRTPFAAEDGSVVMRQHMFQPPPALPPHVPKAVSALCLDMLAKDPTQRPSMAQVVEHIERLDKKLSTTQVVVPPLAELKNYAQTQVREPLLTTVTVRPRRDGRRLVGAAGVLLLVGLLGGLLGVRLLRKESVAPVGAAPIAPDKVAPPKEAAVAAQPPAALAPVPRAVVKKEEPPKRGGGVEGPPRGGTRFEERGKKRSKEDGMAFKPRGSE